MLAGIAFPPYLLKLGGRKVGRLKKGKPKEAVDEEQNKQESGPNKTLNNGFNLQLELVFGYKLMNKRPGVIQHAWRCLARLRLMCISARTHRETSR